MKSKKPFREKDIPGRSIENNENQNRGTLRLRSIWPIKIPRWVMTPVIWIARTTAPLKETEEADNVDKARRKTEKEGA